MVEQQIRTWEVLDARVLEVLGRLHREDYVPAQHRKLAYADLMLPIGEGQVMMRPLVEGRMLQSLALGPGDTVLEIGTGSGYVAACLASLAAAVYSIEVVPSLAASARRRLEQAELDNVTVEEADALGAWSPQRRFDAVAVTGSARIVPERFRDWLNPGGRLFAVRGDAPVMEAVLLRLGADGSWAEESLFETDLPRLIGAEDPDVLDF